MPAKLEVALPSALEIRVDRRFDAPPSLVFDAHSVPALVQRWLLGPPGWTMPVCEIDFTVGGRYAYRWRSEESGHEFGTTGEFLEIDAPGTDSPGLIVHTEQMDGCEGTAVCTSAFVADGDGTAYSITMKFPTEAIRDGALASGMADGMAAGYDRLDRLDGLMAEQAA